MFNVVYCWDLFLKMLSCSKHYFVVFSITNMVFYSILTNLSTIGLQTQKKYDHFLSEYLSRKFLIHILYTCGLARLIL